MSVLDVSLDGVTPAHLVNEGVGYYNGGISNSVPDLYQTYDAGNASILKYDYTLHFGGA